MMMDKYCGSKLISLGQSFIPMIRVPGFAVKDYALILTQDRIKEHVYHIEDINDRSGLEGKIRTPENFKLLT